MKTFTMQGLVLLLCTAVSLSASEIAFIPFHFEGVDSATAGTVNDLLYESLASFSSEKIIKVDLMNSCYEKTCARAAADSIKATQFIFGSARRLGNKWIVRSFHYQSGMDKPLSTHSIDCQSIEDFEPVMKRLAEAIAKRKNTEDVASIDNITEKETDGDRFRRREGFYSLGVQLGYLYPQRSRSYTYWKNDGYTDKIKTQFKQVLSTDLVNWFELPYNLTLQWDVHVGWAAEFGSHLIMLRQFGRGDFSPYLGGGTGLDYCFEGTPPTGVDEDKRNSGFSLIGKGGIVILRTYNFRINADAGYKIVFDDDKDQGIFANIGVMWRKQPRVSTVQHSSSTTNPWILGLAGIGGLVILVCALGIVGGSIGN